MSESGGWDLSKSGGEGGPAGPPPGEPGPGQPYGQPGWGPPPGYGPPGPVGQQPPPGYPPYPPPYPPPGYGPGGFPPLGYPNPYPSGPTTSGKAIAVLVLGIASLVTITCAGVVGAIIALCLAPGAQREIAASSGRLTGEGMVKAGKICSWISIALTVLGILAFVALFVFSTSSSYWQIDIPN
jgi:hypothetical protein